MIFLLEKVKCPINNFFRNRFLALPHDIINKLGNELVAVFHVGRYGSFEFSFSSQDKERGKWCVERGSKTTLYILHSTYYFGVFAPYLLLCCFLPSTPDVSKIPLTI